MCVSVCLMCIRESERRSARGERRKEREEEDERREEGSACLSRRQRITRRKNGFRRSSRSASLANVDAPFVLSLSLHLTRFAPAPDFDSAVPLLPSLRYSCCCCRRSLRLSLARPSDGCCSTGLAPIPPLSSSSVPLSLPDSRPLLLPLSCSSAAGLGLLCLAAATPGVPAAAPTPA